MQQDEAGRLLREVKERKWFYEFDLPDGTRTESDLDPEVRPIHDSRLRKLHEVVARHVPDAARLTALDLASHEGFFSLALARHFASVVGLDIRPESLAAAELITRALGVENVTYERADLQTMQDDGRYRADFVLLYGLIYHVENPIHVLRLAAQFSRRFLLVETQILPFEAGGMMEDGHYRSQRQIHGVFGLCGDYPDQREGGSTDLALVPSLDALLWLLRSFGFAHCTVLDSEDGDYEQYRRRQRVVVFADKGA